MNDQNKNLQIVPNDETSIAKTGDAARAQAEIQASYVMAARFPRDETRAFIALEKACKRHSFAERAEYLFPKGGKDIRGASIHLAREAARVWGNMRTGFRVVEDNDDRRTIEAYAVDMETNSYSSRQSTFRKEVYRKSAGEKQKVLLNEFEHDREMRELTNRNASLLIRNCILDIIPEDIVDNARGVARDTLKRKVSADAKTIEEQRRIVCRWFEEKGVTSEVLSERIGHPLDNMTPDEIVDLQAISRAIIDGTVTLKEAFGRKPQEPVSTAAVDMLAGKAVDKAPDVPPPAEPKRESGDDAEDLPPEAEMTDEMLFTDLAKVRAKEGQKTFDSFVLAVTGKKWDVKTMNRDNLILIYRSNHVKEARAKQEASK